MSAATEARLLLLLAEVAELLAERGDESPEPKERPSADELLANHRRASERRGVLPNSIDSRERRVRALMEWLAPTSILDATTDNIQRYLDSLSLQNGTRSTYTSHFRAFYKWAHDEELIAANPVDRIVSPPKRRGMPRPIADADLAMALEKASDQMLRCYLVLGAFAGLRCQEIAGLHAEDVNRATGVLLVRAGKGDKKRVVPLHPDILRELDRLPLPSSGPVFTFRGVQVRPYVVSHKVQRFLHGIGVSASAHQLRHWFATKTYRGTHDLLLVQNLLGHSSPGVTAVYAAADLSTATPAVLGLSVPAA